MEDTKNWEQQKDAMQNNLTLTVLKHTENSIAQQVSHTLSMFEILYGVSVEKMVCTCTINFYTKELTKAEGEKKMIGFKSREEVQRIKELYPVGTKLILDFMDDPQAIPSGSECTVTCVDDIGQIHVEEFGLAIVPNVDRFHKKE